MEILLANESRLPGIYRVVHETIEEIYPKYYRDEVVAFFHDWHSEEKIAADISAGKVYAIEENGTVVATGTADCDCVTRLFVLPDCQGKGCGSALMDFLERKIIEKYGVVKIDSSLPAGKFYHRRGYVTQEHCEHVLENDKRLAYEVMCRTQI